MCSEEGPQVQVLETAQVGVKNSVLKVHSPFGRVPGGDKP